MGAPLRAQPSAGGEDRATGEAGGQGIAVKHAFVADAIRELGLGQELVEGGAVLHRHLAPQPLDVLLGCLPARRLVTGHRRADDLDQHLGMFASVAIGNVVPAHHAQAHNVHVPPRRQTDRSRVRHEFGEHVSRRTVGHQDPHGGSVGLDRRPHRLQLFATAGRHGRKATHRVKQFCGAQAGPLHRLYEEVAKRHHHAHVEAMMEVDRRIEEGCRAPHVGGELSVRGALEVLGQQRLRFRGERRLDLVVPQPQVLAPDLLVKHFAGSTRRVDGSQDGGASAA